MNTPFAHFCGCFGGQRTASQGSQVTRRQGRQDRENETEEKLSQNEVMKYVPEVLEGALIREML